METVIKIKKEDLQKVKNVLLADDIVSRASVVFKDSKALEFEGDEFYCYVSGLEEACEKAEELTKEFGEVVPEDIKTKVIEKVRGEESTAAEGFGAIFG